MPGQIIKRGEKVWLVRIFQGRDNKGKRRYYNKTIHGRKKDAEKFLTAKLREKDLGVFVEPAAEHLDDFLDRWLKEVAKPRLRPTTYGSYESVLDAYVRPTLGSRQLAHIKAYDVQKLYNSLLEKGKSSRTVRYAHAVLRSALKQALKWNMLSQNPCDLCDLPKSQKTEMKYLNATQAAAFLENAKGDRFYALFALAIETGLRPEEYLGLQWKDIDLDKGTLSVRRALVRTKGGGFDFTEPKTKSSRRQIELRASTASILRSHRKKQLEEKMSLGRDYQDHDLVFTIPIGLPMDLKNLRDRNFKKIRDAAKVPAIRLYDLRHTCATLLLTAGVHPKVVAERLGHSSVVLTLDTYSHVIPSMQRNAADALDRIMSQK